MKLSRLFLPFVVALSLLSAQQAGAAHTIAHAVQQSQQQDQDASHGGACEKCENYFQLGNALSIGIYTPPALTAAAEPAAPFVAHLQIVSLRAATARGPPSLLRHIA